VPLNLDNRGNQLPHLHIGATIARPKSASSKLTTLVKSNVSTFPISHYLCLGHECSGVFVEEKETDPNSFQVPVIGVEN